MTFASGQSGSVVIDYTILYDSAAAAAAAVASAASHTANDFSVAIQSAAADAGVSSVFAGLTVEAVAVPVEPSRCQAKPTGQGSTRAGAGRVLFGQVADESRRFRGESGRGEALSGSFLGREGPQKSTPYPGFKLEFKKTHLKSKNST